MANTVLPVLRIQKAIYSSVTPNELPTKPQTYSLRHAFKKVNPENFTGQQIFHLGTIMQTTATIDKYLK